MNQGFFGKQARHSLPLVWHRVIEPLEHKGTSETLSNLS